MNVVDLSWYVMVDFWMSLWDKSDDNLVINLKARLRDVQIYATLFLLVEDEYAM